MMRWECRHSSSEMLYLEVTATDVRCYLDHSPASASVWTFEQIVAGEADRELFNFYSAAEIAEMKAEARRRISP